MRGKRVFIIVFVSLLLLSAWPASGSQAYLMRCKGGTPMIDANGAFFIILSKAPSHLSVGMNQCAWMDRVLDANEKSVLRAQILSDVDLSQVQPSAVSGTQFKGACNFTCNEFVSKLIRKVLSRSEYLLMVSNAGSFMLILQEQPYL